MSGRLLLTAALLSAAPAPAYAQDEICEAAPLLQPTRVAWKTAHALLGRPPTLDELMPLRGLAHGPEADRILDGLVDGWLTRRDYRLQMRRMHLDDTLATPMPPLFGVHINSTRHLVPVRCEASESCSYDPAAPDDGLGALYDWTGNSGFRRGNRWGFVQQAAPACRYELPAFQQRIPDTFGRLVRPVMVFADGTRQRLLLRSGPPEAPDDCNGWHYGGDAGVPDRDALSPTEIRLCAPQCDAVDEGRVLRVKIEWVANPQTVPGHERYLSCSDADQADVEAHCAPGPEAAACHSDADCAAGGGRCDADVTGRCVPADCCRARHGGRPARIWGRRPGLPQFGFEEPRCSEGSVLQRPYWGLPDEPIRACGLAGQAAETTEVVDADANVNFIAGRFSCAEPVHGGHPNLIDCGCGEGLKWCDARDFSNLPMFRVGRTTDGEDWVAEPDSRVSDGVRRSMQEQFLRMVDDVTCRTADSGDPRTDCAGDPAPYPELLMGRDAWVDGRLIHFYRHMARPAGRAVGWIEADEHGYWRPPGEGGVAPALPEERCADDRCLDGALPAAGPDDPAWRYTFIDANWYRVTRGPLHAGVLTTPAFLHRHFTNRARVNRFRIAFLGRDFEPASRVETPDDPLYADPCYEGGVVGDDLRQRCNCRHCHRLLDPLAGHFAPFQRYGTSLLAMYPPTIWAPSGAQALRTVASYFQPTNSTGGWRDTWKSVYAPVHEELVRRGDSWASRIPGHREPDVPCEGDAQCPETYSCDAGVCVRSAYQLAALSWAWKPEYADDFARYAEGPRGLVEREGMAAAPGAAHSRLAQGTVQRVFKFLMGREMALFPVGDEPDERALLIELSEWFEGEAVWDFKRLVRRIVRLRQFRTAP